ncbi:MAG TPA: adenylate/guanylate cyclase domain-containing protein [Bacteroidota bacterium]|nr:adenylate/guanylate cyclase domain-containing protein [Bacteroidota bacterium]
MAKDLKSQIKKEATDHLRNADRIFKLGDYPAALAEVDQALALDPQNYYALAFRKRILEVYTPGQASSAPSPASAPTEVAPPPAPSPTSPVVEADIAQATRQKRAPQRKLAAIMFTDMVGYSAVTQKNESLAIELLDRHRRILRPIFPEFEGQEIKTIGDAFLVEFPSVLQAVQCGMAIQRAMGDYNAASDSTYKMELRVGIHLGDVIYQEDDIIGDGVNIAARIHEQAEPGGICVSQDVYNQIRNREGFHFEDKGEVMLKNILLPVHVYKITTTEEAYRKIEEKTLEEAREEGIRKARVDFLQKSIDKATELLSSESTDAALAELMKVYALDPDNADAKALEESIRAERKKAFEQEIQQASAPPREIYLGIYRNILKRIWIDGALSPMERSLIETIRASFRISDSEHESVEHDVQKEVYAEIAKSTIKNGEKTQEQEENLARLRSELSITLEEQLQIEGPTKILAPPAPKAATPAPAASPAAEQNTFDI